MDPNNFTRCIACPVDKPKYDLVKMECTECGLGEFADYANINKCIPCPA